MTAADDPCRSARARGRRRGRSDLGGRRLDRRRSSSIPRSTRPVPCSLPASSTSTSTAGAAMTPWATLRALDGMARALLRRGRDGIPPDRGDGSARRPRTIRRPRQSVDCRRPLPTAPSLSASISRARSCLMRDGAPTTETTSSPRPTSPTSGSSASPTDSRSRRSRPSCRVRRTSSNGSLAAASRSRSATRQRTSTPRASDTPVGLDRRRTCSTGCRISTTDRRVLPSRPSKPTTSSSSSSPMATTSTRRSGR